MYCVVHVGDWRSSDTRVTSPNTIQYTGTFVSILKYMYKYTILYILLLILFLLYFVHNCHLTRAYMNELPWTVLTHTTPTHLDPRNTNNYRQICWWQTDRQMDGHIQHLSNILHCNSANNITIIVCKRYIKICLTLKT